MKNQSEKREPHALDCIAFSEELNGWEQRVREWHGFMSFSERLEWLHTNRNREGNGPEKAIFFLELADRYGQTHLFKTDQNENIVYTVSEGHLYVYEMKRKLSQKAFAILAQTFFRRTEEYSGFPIYLPYEDPLFSKLLWFFRPYGGLGGWDNLRPGFTEGLGKDNGEHYVLLAKNFAKEFAMNSWQLLNKCWNKCWDYEPNRRVTFGHTDEIVMLMRRTGQVDSMHGQFKPLRQVFRIMVRTFLEEQGQTKIDEESLDNKDYVKRILEPLIKSGDSFAKNLYLMTIE